MDAVTQIYLLLICQGFYLGSVGQSWTFPGEVTALIGSCVEIPCSHLSRTLTHNFSTVWYLYNGTSYLQILNTKDSSSVLEGYRGRTSLVPGLASCTLRIDPVRRDDGKYRYFPGNPEDKSIDPFVKATKGLKFYVRDRMIIQLPGYENMMTEGVATTIRCTAEHTCGSTPPTLQWNRPGRVTNQSVEISGGFWREESNFTFVPSYVDDGSRIRCTATYPNGQKSERTLLATVNYPPKNVTVVIFGEDEVMEGGDASLRCDSVSKPRVPTEYEWYKGKEKLPQRGQYLTVRKVTWKMEPYSCAAINEVGRGESAPIKIPVLYEPKHVTVTVIGTDEVMEGSDVTLQCNSFSNPNISDYEWYKGKEKSRLPERGREMTVRKVTWNMEPYSCTAINGVGKRDSSLMEIPVQYAPKNVTVTVIGKDKVMEGSDVTLQCNSFSNPDVSEYEWYKGKEKSRLPDTGREITVMKVTWNMEPYSCTAINAVGRGGSFLMEIPVQYKDFSITCIILSATLGMICLLLLGLFVYCFWRKRCQRSNETAIPPDATYANLVKKEIENS